MIHVETDGTRVATRAPVRDGAADVVNASQLRAIVEPVERVREEQKALADDLKEIYQEARGNGFDAAAIKEIVKLRALDPDKRVEHETILDVYKSAIGMA